MSAFCVAPSCHRFIALQKWNRRWFVLHCTTIEGIVRLEYFDNESYEATAMGKRTIPLRQCRDISPTGGTKTHPYVFQFTTPMGEDYCVHLHGSSCIYILVWLFLTVKD